MVAAELRQVAAGDDAELGRERLEQHRDQIGQQDDPEQEVAVLGAGLDVGGEVAGVHVGDRGDHRRAGESQKGPHPPRRPASTLAAAAVRSESDRATMSAAVHSPESAMENFTLTSVWARM